MDEQSAPFPQMIVCAAMKHALNGRIITGARHYDSIMREQINLTEGSDSWKGCTQGFIDQRGNFLTRAEAYEIAEKNGQIRREIGYKGRKLFSEHLY